MKKIITTTILTMSLFNTVLAAPPTVTIKTSNSYDETVINNIKATPIYIGVDSLINFLFILLIRWILACFIIYS